MIDLRPFALGGALIFALATPMAHARDLVATGTSAAESGRAQARAFLESIYAPYATDGNIGDFAQRPERYFEPELARAVQALRDEMDKLGKSDASLAEAEASDAWAVMWDPLCQCMDTEPFDVTIEEFVGSGDSYSADVHFSTSNSNGDIRQTIRLVRTTLGWRVADIVRDENSFREKILQAAAGRNNTPAVTWIDAERS